MTIPVHPSAIPQVLAVKALEAVKAYERDCETLRQALSQERWNHRGAFIPEAMPTDEGRAAAIEKVLEAEVRRPPVATGTGWPR